MAIGPPRVEGSRECPQLSGWPNVSISKQKGTVRVASHPPRVEGPPECAGALWVAKCKHFRAKRHCASGQSPSPRPGLTRVCQELSGWPNVSISKQKGTVRVAIGPPRVQRTSQSAPELSGWPNVSISKQKATVRVAMSPLRVQGSRECARSSLGGQM